MIFDVNDLGLILVVLAFGVLLIRAIIDVVREGNIQKAYIGFITGFTGNAELSDAVESRYVALNPSQKRMADLAFDFVDLISRATPGTEDDVMQQWTKQVRDGLPNTKPVDPPAVG